MDLRELTAPRRDVLHLGLLFEGDRGEHAIFDDAPEVVEGPSHVVDGFLPVVAVSVIGGLVIYNTLFALLGSLISRQEDTGQVMLPAIAPAMVGFVVAQVAITGNAQSTVAKVLTLVPLTAPSQRGRRPPDLALQRVRSGQG